MTMIVSAHLGDSILIATDKRAIVCDLETGSMHISNDDEQKIKLWNRGAIAGTGETLFLNRIADYFIQFDKDGRSFKQMDAIYQEIERRLEEGVPKEVLINNTIIFSIFDGTETLLYSIPMEPFFDVTHRNGIEMIYPYMHEIKAWTVDVTCFNLPPDMSNLQNFQRHLKGLCDFEDEKSFIEYYIAQLKLVFMKQAEIDPSITPSFDLYIQSCRTGQSLALHVPNLVLSSPISENLNFWDRNR